jgi:hypothetical protein
MTPHFPLGRLAGEFYDNGGKLVTLRPLQFMDSEYGVDVTVPEAFTTDFNSTPRAAWFFFARWEYPAAGALHDYVFRHPPEGWTRQNCDWLHWRVLRVLGCPKVKAEIIFQILSRGSKGAWNRYRALDKA